MNQEQNNLNLNNFNAQGNNGIPNNQPLNNQNVNQGMSFNQQPINPQPQPTPSYEQSINQMNIEPPAPQSMNTFENGNINNQNFNSKPPKKMNLGLIIGIVVAVIIVGFGIVLVSNVFSDNKNENNIVKDNNNDNFSKSYYDVNDIDISKLGDTISWSQGWDGTVNFLIKKPLGDKYNYFHYENNKNGIIVITDGFTDIYDNQTIDSVIEQSKNQIYEYLNKSLESDLNYNIIFNKQAIKNISSSSKFIRAIYSEIYNSEKFEKTSYDMILYDGKITSDINKEMKFNAFVVQSSIQSTYYTYMLIIDGTDDQSIDNTILEKYALDMAHSFYEYK